MEEQNSGAFTRSEDAYNMLKKFIEACLDCVDEKELLDFVMNNAEKTIEESEALDNG